MPYTEGEQDELLAALARVALRNREALSLTLQEVDLFAAADGAVAAGALGAVLALVLALVFAWR